MNKQHKRQLRRILVAAALFSVGMFFRFLRPDAFPFGETGLFFLFLAAYALVGLGVVRQAVATIARGQVFDENFLMTIATLGAFGLGEYPEAAAVMLFYQVGELFQSYAVHKSRRSISELMNIRPDYANVLRDGTLAVVPPEEVRTGETIVTKPGERIPLDGVVLDGFSTLDVSALTGESAPREIGPGEEILSGCINQGGKLTIRVDREFGQSTVARILELVENASARKSRSEAFITRFARYYTPFVVLAAAVLAMVPPLATGDAFSPWIARALTILVISCPCALVISVPLSFFGGLGGASKLGLLVKGSNYLEALAAVKTMVFDKTGTLTHGTFAVAETRAVGMQKEELLQLAAYAEDSSSHPIAESIRKAYGQKIHPERIAAVEEIPGHGIRAVIDGKTVLAGNARLMRREKVAMAGPLPEGTAVHVAADGVYAGCILIEDEIKPDAARAIADLRRAGVETVVMLTGDADVIGKKVARTLGLDRVYTELLPADKVGKVEELLREKGNAGAVAFVGDGINDAPVLARADVGIAMGGVGSDAAIEAADVVIMTDEPSRIVAAIGVARKTLDIVRQNIVFALAVKGVVLLLGALGYASMWAAVFADVGVSVIAIANAVRALRVGEFTGATADGGEDRAAREERFIQDAA